MVCWAFGTLARAAWMHRLRRCAMQLHESSPYSDISCCYQAVEHIPAIADAAFRKLPPPSVTTDVINVSNGKKSCSTRLRTFFTRPPVCSPKLKSDLAELTSWDTYQLLKSNCPRLHLPLRCDPMSSNSNISPNAIVTPPITGECNSPKLWGLLNEIITNHILHNS